MNNQIVRRAQRYLLFTVWITIIPSFGLAIYAKYIDDSFVFNCHMNGLCETILSAMIVIGISALVPYTVLWLVKGSKFNLTNNDEVIK